MENQISIKNIFFCCLISFILFFQIGIIPASAQNLNEENFIPNWFKTSINWWQEEKITNDEIINSIEYLWQNEIIKRDSNEIEKISPNPNLSPFSNEKYNKIISKTKQDFKLWTEESISNEEILKTLGILIKNRIINHSEYSPTKLSAALIDVLDDSNPNRLAQEKIKKFLEQAGYHVDIFTAKEATVDFYSNLPSMNYSFIYIRTHSLEIPELNNATFLFTGEKYNINKYFSEQLSGQLAKGIPVYDEEIVNLEESDSNTYFMISSKFVDEKMKGEFPESLIVIGGCESIKNLDFASSLVSRGASSVIGWTNPILAGENDRAMLTLFEEILVKKSNINDSIETVMKKYESNLLYESTLRYVHPIS